MRLLLDTHVFLWCIEDKKKLSSAARTKILHATEVYISSASIWEIIIKIQIKKLKGDITHIIGAIAESGFLELPIYANHVATIARLADIHRDPFDRILIAQAIYEPLTFLTADVKLKGYSELVEVIE